MTTRVVAEGNIIEVTLAGTVAAGAIFESGHTLGVYLSGGVSGDVVAVQIRGRVTMPKVSAAVWVAGEKLIWDTSAQGFDDSAATPATGDLTGAAIAAGPGANTETTCEVILTPGNVTKT